MLGVFGAHCEIVSGISLAIVKMADLSVEDTASAGGQSSKQGKRMSKVRSLKAVNRSRHPASSAVGGGI